MAALAVCIPHPPWLSRCGSRLDGYGIMAVTLDPARQITHTSCGYPHAWYSIYFLHFYGCVYVTCPVCGTAFAYRHYDAVEDKMQKVYNKIFRYSSFITPLFLGIIAGSAVSGTINPQAKGFADAYIFSWVHYFSVAVGLFTVSICGYLAA